jgi:hypothetical protein
MYVCPPLPVIFHFLLAFCLPPQAPDDSNIGLQELDQVLLRAGHPANLMNLPVRKMVNR